MSLTHRLSDRLRSSFPILGAHRRAHSKRRVLPVERAVRACLEGLESRILLSTINWTNEFDPANNFSTVFGVNADLARRVVESTVHSWEHVITNFHTSTNTFSINISMAPNSLGQGAATNVTASENGIPTAASMVIAAGADGHGSYLFLDPTVPANPNQFNPVDSFFLGNNSNAYASAATNDTGLRDLYTLVLHEVGHAVGFSSADTGGHTLRLATTPYAHDVTNPPGNPIGDDYVFQGPSVTTLLTSDNGGTSNFGAPIHADYYDHTATYLSTNYIGSDDLMVPGLGSQERRLISESDALVLKDIYGYDIVRPDTLNNFYVALDPSSGVLTVRGNQFVDTGRGYNPSSDTVALTTSGSQLVVSVGISAPPPGATGPNPLTEVFSLAGVQAINVYPGAGSTAINVDDSANTSVYTGAFMADSSIQVGWGVIGGLGVIADINFRYSGTSGVTVRTSTANGDVFSVLDAGVTTTVVSGGSGTVDVGTSPGTFSGNGSLTGIRAQVFIDNASTNTAINIDDSGDATARNFVVGTNGFNSNWGFVHAASLPNFSIDYRYAAASGLTLRTGTAAGNIEGVWQDGIPTSIVNDGPGASVNVGNGNNGVQSILATLNLSGALYGGDTAVYVDDRPDNQARTAIVGTFTPPNDSLWGFISGLDPHADIHFKCASTSGVTVNTDAAAGNYVAVWQTGVTTNIVCNGGAATVNAGNGNDGVQSILGTLNISSALGFYDTAVYIGDQANHSPRTATLGTFTASDSTLWGFVSGLPYANINYKCLTTANLYVGGGPGGDTFSVQSTPGPQFAIGVGLVSLATTINCAAGDTVNVGDANGMQDINGKLTVNGAQPDYVTLNLNDQQDATGRTPTVTNAAITGLAPAEIDYGAFSLANLNINGGGGGDTFNVLSTPASEFVPNVGIAYTLTTLTCAGVDTVNVGDATGVQDVLGTLTVNNALPNDVTLNLNDQNDGTGRTVTVSSGGVSGLAPADIDYGLSPLRNLTVNGGAGADTFNVESFPASAFLRIFAGGGLDQINVEPTQQVLPSFLNGFTVDGGAGGAALSFNNANSLVGPPAVITSTGFSLGSGTANYSNISSLIYTAGIHSTNTINILSTSPLTSYSVNAGTGSNTLNLGLGDITGLVSNIAFAATGSNDAVNVNDQNDAAAQAYTIALGSISVAGLFTYSTAGGFVEATVVNAGNGADSIAVTGRPITTPTTVNGGGGNDAITVGTPSAYFSNIASPITVNGNAGTDTLGVFDSNSYGYRITNTSVADFFLSNVSHLVNYATMEAVALTTPGGLVNTQVQSTASGTPVTVNPGNGSNFGDGVTLGGPGFPLDGILSPVTVNGHGGTGNAANNLTLDDSSDTTADVVHVTPTAVGAAPGDTLFGPGGSLAYGGVAGLTLNTPNAPTGDAISVVPSSTTTFIVNAGNPVPPTASGDSLAIAGVGVTNPLLTPNGTGAGQYTFGNRMPVAYTGVEQASIDSVAPVVLSINRSSPAGPNIVSGVVTSVTYAVTFSEAVSGVTAAEFAPAFTGSTSASTPVVVSGSGANYTVTINNITGSGTLGLNLLSDGAINDIAGNPIPSGTGFTGQVYTVTAAAPVVAAFTIPAAVEGTAFAPVNGSFTGQAGDSFTATVNYGDGSGPQPLALTGNAFTLSHAYAEGGTYAVGVVVTDATASLAGPPAAANVNISDAAVQVSIAGAPATISLGGSVNLTFIATNPNPLEMGPLIETWTITDSANAVVASGTSPTTNFRPTQAGAYTVTFTAGESAGGTDTETGTAIAMITVNPAAPAFVGITIGDGTAQRSAFNSFALSFSQPVTLGAGAITLDQIATDSNGAILTRTPVSPAAFILSNPSHDGKNWVATVTALGALDNGHGDFIDGVFLITMHAAQVTNGMGATLAGGDATLSFLKLYGDVNGDGTVGPIDFGRFRTAYGSGVGDANFNAAFDIDHDGTIGPIDFGKFRSNYGKILYLPV